MDSAAHTDCALISLVKQAEYIYAQMDKPAFLFVNDEIKMCLR